MDKRRQLILCFLCIVAGGVLPWMVDVSKSAVATIHMRKSDSGDGQFTTRTKMMFPYSITSLLLLVNLFSVFLGMAILLLRDGISKTRAQLTIPSVWRRLFSLAIVHGVGDLVTMLALGNSSGLVYIVIGQTKILVTAVLSRWMLGPSRALTIEQWGCLSLIVLTAAAFSVLETGDSSIGVTAYAGLFWSAVKCVMSGVVGVMAEMKFKEADVFATSTILKAYDTVFLLLLCCIPSVSHSMQNPLCDSEEFINCMRDTAVGGVCQCIDRQGWDWYTWSAVSAHVLNGWLTVFILKQLSAVVKYVCRALTAPALYLCYCLMGRSSLDGRLVCLVIMVGNVLAYRRFAKPKEAPVDAEWTSEYRPMGGTSVPVPLQIRQTARWQARDVENGTEER